MNRKWMVLLLAGALSASLCACGGTAETKSAPEEPPEPVVEEVQDAEYTLTLKDWNDDGTSSETECTGTFTGTLVDGLADGEGVFSATNSEGLSWTYTGGFKDGTFNGYGESTWDNGDYTDQIGTFTDGLYTPTKSEFLKASQDFYQNSVAMPDTAKEFIDAHEALFPCESEEAKGEAFSLTNEEVTRKQLVKNATPYTGELFTANNLEIVQIFEEPVWGYTLSWILAQDSDYQAYDIYYLGSVDVYEGDKINIRALPLGNSGFDNVSGGTTNVVVCAGSIVEKV